MKGWLFRLAALGLGLAFSLGVCELALRLSTPPWLHQRMAELRAGEFQELGTDRGWPIVEENGRFVKFRPSSRFTISHYEYRHSADVDELGARVVPDAPSVAETVPFVGDSFVFGIGVPDRDTFVNLLARSAQRRLVNLGFPGTSLNRQLDIVEKRHVELGSPTSYVFVVFLGNDLAELRDTALAESPSKRPEPQPRLRLAQLNSFVYHHRLLKRIFLIQFVRQKLLAFFDRTRSTGMDPIFRVLQVESRFLAEAGGLYRDELLRLQRLSRERGFEPLFVLVPDRHQINERLLTLRADYYGLDASSLDASAPNRTLAKMLNDLRIEFIDTTECLRAAGRTTDIYYVQDNHLNVVGHRALANCLSQEGVLSRIVALRE
jgi:hypothetical protein